MKNASWTFKRPIVQSMTEVSIEQPNKCFVCFSFYLFIFLLFIFLLFFLKNDMKKTCETGYLCIGNMWIFLSLGPSTLRWRKMCTRCNTWLSKKPTGVAAFTAQTSSMSLSRHFWKSSSFRCVVVSPKVCRPLSCESVPQKDWFSVVEFLISFLKLSRRQWLNVLTCDVLHTSGALCALLCSS